MARDRTRLPRFLESHQTHINITAIGPAGVKEMLARAKMAPLYLEAGPSRDTYLGTMLGLLHSRK
jgi:hypothetical protein